MASKNDHAVDKAQASELPAPEISKKYDERYREAETGDPAKQGKPVFLRLENIESVEKFSKNFWAGGVVEVPVSFENRIGGA